MQPCFLTKCNNTSGLTIPSCMDSSNQLQKWNLVLLPWFVSLWTTGILYGWTFRSLAVVWASSSDTSLVQLIMSELSFGFFVTKPKFHLIFFDKYGLFLIHSVQQWSHTMIFLTDLRHWLLGTLIPENF